MSPYSARMLLLLVFVFEVGAGFQCALQLPTRRIANQMPRSSVVQATGGKPVIELSQPSQDKYRAFDITTWNFAAFGEAEFDGRSVYGDNVGSFKPPSSARQLSERLGNGSFRYVYAGSGTVTADGKSYQVNANTLLEVTSDSAELLWTLSDGCDVMVLGAPEYDSPARRIVRGALPYIGGVLAALAVAAIVSEGLAGNL